MIREQCQAITKLEKQCSRQAMIGHYCLSHFTAKYYKKENVDKKKYACPMCEDALEYESTHITRGENNQCHLMEFFICHNCKRSYSENEIKYGRVR